MTALLRILLSSAFVLIGVNALADENNTSASLTDLQQKYELEITAKNYSDAIKSITKIISLQEQDDSNKNAPELRNARFSLGVTYHQNQQYQLSLEILLQVKNKYEVIDGERLNYARVLHWLALNFQYLDQLKQAKDAFNQSVSIKEELLGKDNLELAATYKDFAAFSEKTKDQANTIVYYEKLLNVYQKAGFSDQLSITALQDTLASHYSAIQNYPEAISLQKDSTAIRKKELGEDHLETISSMATLAHYYQQLGLKKKALTLYQTTLKLQIKKQGSEHKDVAQTYSKIADVLREIGSTELSLEFYKKALTLNKKVLGLAHSETIKSRQDLAKLYRALGKVDSSLKLLIQNVKTQEKNHGIDHIETANAYSDLASLYDEMNLPKKALEFYTKTSQIQERVWGRSHDLGAKIYNKIGEVHQRLKNYGKAQEFYSKALRAYDAIYGAEHLNTAISFNNLGLLNQELLQTTKAQHYFNKALNIRQKILGENHLLTAETLSTLADFYMSIKAYENARINYLKALSIRKKKLGKHHALTAQTNNKIGRSLLALNENIKAINYFNLALETNVKALGRKHREVASNLNNLGLAHQSLGNNIEAVEAFNEASIVMIAVFGKDNYQLANVYSRLALLSVKQNDLSKALAFNQKALNIREGKFGLNHLETASSYSALADIYEKQEKYKTALKHYQKVLDIQHKLVGKEHFSNAQTNANIAQLYKKMGHINKSYSHSEKAFELLYNYQRLVFPGLTQQQKLALLKQLDETFSALLEATYEVMQSKLKKAHKTKALASTIDYWMKTKGSYFDAENTLLSLYASTDDKPVKSKIMQLISSARSLSIVLNSPPVLAEHKPWRNNIAMYTRRIEILNKIISDRVNDYNNEQKLALITKQELVAQLSKETLYIDYIKTKNHYYFFTLNDAGKISFNRFNEEVTGSINQLIQLLNDENKPLLKGKKIASKKMKTKIKRAKENLSELYTFLIETPLKEQLQDRKSLIVSPDSMLRLLPFSALFNQEDKAYLIEKISLSYIPNAKNLVRLSHNISYKKEGDDNNKSTIFVFSNPDFDLALEKENTKAKKKKRGDKLSSSADETQLIQALSNQQFKKVGDSKSLIKLIKKSVKGISFLEFSKSKATAKNLLNIENVDSLYLSSHSYAIDPDKSKVINPMLMTGLVLAGANKSIKQGKTDATLSAYKLSRLNLESTRLVVLSLSGLNQNICATQQAFIQAGAKSSLISLWPIKSYKKKNLLQSFYKGLKKKPSGEALRDSQLSMIKADVHPFYWSQMLFTGIN